MMTYKMFHNVAQDSQKWTSTKNSAKAYQKLTSRELKMLMMMSKKFHSSQKLTSNELKMLKMISKKIPDGVQGSQNWTIAHSTDNNANHVQQQKWTSKSYKWYSLMGSQKLAYK